MPDWAAITTYPNSKLHTCLLRVKEPCLNLEPLSVYLAYGQQQTVSERTTQTSIDLSSNLHYWHLQNSAEPFPNWYVWQVVRSTGPTEEVDEAQMLLQISASSSQNMVVKVQADLAQALKAAVHFASDE